MPLHRDGERRSPPSWSIRPEAPMPEDLSMRHGLFALYALQEWECLRHPSDGPYKPGVFYNKVFGILNGLHNPTRKTALHNLANAECTACGDPVSLANTIGDHLVAVRAGGPESIQNTILLCRRCNSSKGSKDLLVWWMEKTYPPALLDRRILCLYARMNWQLRPNTFLDNPLHSSIAAFLQCRAASLPTEAHRIALYGATYAGCAFSRWLEG